MFGGRSRGTELTPPTSVFRRGPVAGYRFASAPRSSAVPVASATQTTAGASLRGRRLSPDSGGQNDPRLLPKVRSGTPICCAERRGVDRAGEPLSAHRERLRVGVQGTGVDADDGLVEGVRAVCAGPNHGGPRNRSGDGAPRHRDGRSSHWISAVGCAGHPACGQGPGAGGCTAPLQKLPGPLSQVAPTVSRRSSGMLPWK